MYNLYFRDKQYTQELLRKYVSGSRIRNVSKKTQLFLKKVNFRAETTKQSIKNVKRKETVTTKTDD